MDTLKKIGSAVKNAATTVASKLGGVISKTAPGLGALGRTLANNRKSPASAGMAFPLDPGISTSTLKQNQTVAPTMSTPQGPAYTTASGQINVQNINTGTTNYQATAAINLRPSTSSTNRSNTGTNNRTRSSQAPTPETAQSGSTGDGGGGTSSQQYSYPGLSFEGANGLGGSGSSSFDFSLGGASSGTTGEGGGSAFTGLLGAVGGASTSGASLTEEDRRRAAEKTGTQILNPISTQTGAALKSINTPPTTGLQAPTVPEVIDMGWIEKVRTSINGLETSGAGMSANDRQSLIHQLSTNLIAAKQKLDQKQPVPENPVEDTPDQAAALETAADPFGLKNAMDAFRMEQTNLATLQKTRVELTKNIQALNEAYRPIIKDIKTNPDLPKALSARRLKDLAETQKDVLQGFLDQLDIVKTEISDQNEIVNRQFQIITFAENKEERRRDDARSSLQMMISSGAVGGFTDADIQKYAAVAGVSTNSLMKIRETALKPKTDQQLIGNSSTGYYSVVTDEESGKVLSKTLVMGAAPSTQTGGGGGSKGGGSKGSAKTGQQTAAPGNAAAELEDDIRNGVTNLNDLKAAYPELTGSQILATMNKINPQPKAKTGTVSNIPGAVAQKVTSWASRLFGR